jgi:DNA modification methylase
MIDKINIEFHNLQRKYANSHRAIRFDFRELVVSNLQIKRSDVFTHSIHKYPGRLFPYIPISFLSTDAFCPPEGKVLDPFSGSGTVLLESIVNPLFKRDAYGVEINPVGRLISKAKTTPLNPKRFDEKIKQLLSSMKNRIYALDYKKYVPKFKNLDMWFSKNTITKLAKLKHVIEQFEDDDYKDFFWLCYSQLIRGVSKADPYIPPPVVLKLEKYKNSTRYKKLKLLSERNECPDVKALYKQIVNENAVRVKRLWDIDEIRRKSVEARIIWDDARNIKRATYLGRGMLKKGYSRNISSSFSLIVTSPPYLSAQKYIRSTGLEALWLGVSSEEGLKELNKASIGTEKVSLGKEKVKFSISSIDRLLNKVEKKSKHRMLVVSEYFKNMADVFKSSYEMLHDNGYMILVLGNNMVCDMAVNTTKLLSEIAQNVGFSEELILKDEIRSRGMLTKRHDTGGLIKDEYVLVLRKYL